MGNLESRLFVFSMVLYNLIAHVSCPGESRVRMYCDFEKDMCSWRHETQYTGGLKWHHSEPNPVGCDKQLCPYYNDRYLYVTSNHLVRNGSFVRISHYPLNAQVTGECSLTMKYIAHGVGFAKLVIGIRMIGYREPESILVIYSSRATDWYQVKVPLIASYVFTPVIEAVRSSDLSSDDPSDGFIAVDDVVLSEGCLTRPDEESNFDSGSQNTKNSTETVKANLEEIFGDQGEQEESELPTGLRQLNYEQASIPNEPSSDLVVKNMTHYVDEFESLPKPLKSVSCKEGELCEKIPLNCSDPEFRCNFIKDCEDGTDELSCPHSCNLDEINDQEQFKQLCGWSQSQQGTKYGTWVLISSIYASKYFENYPRTDANLGTKLGKYLILNVIKSSLIPAIHLNSPTFFSAKNTCYFTFSYIIYDQSAVFYITLTVEPDKITNHRGMSVSLLWKSNLLATPASRWRNASAYIGQQSDPFYLTFVRSSAPYSSHGTIALDNLKFRAC